MYEKQVKIVQAVLKEFAEQAPDAYSYISNEAKAGATGLEYYGMLRKATNEAFKNELIPKELKSKVKAIDAAVHYMYTS
jgi:hypothetical protein